ncbi:hypothetical protein HOD29_05720 [archaeon]|jgi:hypothetical protein|nr:hypothetical protein [archaeon]
MKSFDYYLFIDYSENYLGYLIIGKEEIREFLPKISKFAHYRELKHKKAYLNSIRKIVDKNKVCDHLCKIKIRKTELTPEIYSDILDFIKKNENHLIFISVDNKQFKNFKKLVNIVDGKNTRVIKESELKKHTPEYKISLVLDTLLNLARLKNDKF